ncbi:MAG TPA: hypothetical protein VNT53_09235 [Pseudolysinimonas sp.]|nr:hypothetical protein [Pseudolysinimonas sp.]
MATQNTLGEGDLTFTFNDSWAGSGHHDGSSDSWAHHGLVVTDADEVYTFSEERSEVQVYSLDGTLLRSFPVDIVEGHGFLLVGEGAEQQLWISDIGTKVRRAADGSYGGSATRARGAAVRFSLDGKELQRITVPDLDIYADTDFSPTQVAVDEERFGGTGDIWLADAYGANVVHRFTKDGSYVSTLNGEEGAGRFQHPHAVYIDRRGATPELYITDRRNKRIQVFSLEGEYLRSFGDDFLLSPSAFLPYDGDKLLVLELDGRIAVLGPDNTLVGSIGEGADRWAGWPNGLAEDGSATRPELSPSKFNTPHAVGADSKGNLYVAEWLIGGRLVKLEKQG